MNKKIEMFVICVVFALIISCKNYVNGKDLETSEQSLEIPKQVEQEIKKEFNGLLNILETKDLSKLDEEGTKEIEKQIQELKEKIDKTDSKKTPIETYLEYEKKIQEIREKLKNKKELKDTLKGLEDSLKKKKEERRQKLEEAQKTFQELKGKVDGTTGVTDGDKAQNQREVGQQALKCAKEFGLSVSYSNSADTSNMSNEIITNALKQIEEELKDIGEGTQISENKK